MANSRFPKPSKFRKPGHFLIPPLVGRATKDLNLWRNELLPVFFILYDAVAKQAYWFYIQAYLEKSQVPDDLKQKQLTLQIPMTNLLTRDTIQKFREYKTTLLTQLSGKALYYV